MRWERVGGVTRSEKTKLFVIFWILPVNFSNNQYQLKPSGEVISTRRSRVGLTRTLSLGIEPTHPAIRGKNNLRQTRHVQTRPPRIGQFSNIPKNLLKNEIY